jgi:hypothetical protein
MHRTSAIAKTPARHESLGPRRRVPKAGQKRDRSGTSAGYNWITIALASEKKVRNKRNITEIQAKYAALLDSLL